MASPGDEGALEGAARALAAARRLYVVTGAGISAESGLPTYRGIGGLYEDSETDDGIPIEQALSGEVMRRRPDITWRHIRHIEEAVRGARASRAHRLLASLDQRLDEVLVVTQNVDGFHREAGSRHVVDLHGDVHDLVCTRCGDRQRVESFAHLPPGVPACELCGAVIRPDVVLFGEMLPEAKLDRMQRSLDRSFDLYLAIGTTALFAYIYGPIVDAAARGLPTAEINPGETALSGQVRHRIRMGAGDALEQLIKRAFAAR